MLLWAPAPPGEPSPFLPVLLMSLSSALADRVLLALLVLLASQGPVVHLALKVQLVLWAQKVRR